jgi:hypothetical protein
MCIEAAPTLWYFAHGHNSQKREREKKKKESKSTFYFAHKHIPQKKQKREEKKNPRKRPKSTFLLAHKHTPQKGKKRQKRKRKNPINTDLQTKKRKNRKKKEKEKKGKREKKIIVTASDPRRLSGEVPCGVITMVSKSQNTSHSLSHTCVYLPLPAKKSTTGFGYMITVIRKSNTHF